MRNLRGLRKYSKRCSKSRTKLAEPNALLLLAASFVLLLGGCLGYPISQDTQEYSINGDVAGVKSDPDEKVIVVGTAYGTQWLFSPEGPRRFMSTVPTTFRYYLEKSGERVALQFLYAGNAKERWNFFLNIRNQWFAFNTEVDPRHFLLVQFDSNANHQTHKIPVFRSSAIAQMYIDKDARYLLWRQIGDGYYEYKIAAKTKTKRHTEPGVEETQRLIQIPSISARVEDISFQDALYSDSATQYTGYRSQEVAQTKSLELLRNASASDNYLNRWAVAVNPNTPRYLLERLADDDSFYVANEARKRLQSLPEKDDNSSLTPW